MRTNCTYTLFVHTLWRILYTRICTNKWRYTFTHMIEIVFVSKILNNLFFNFVDVDTCYLAQLSLELHSLVCMENQTFRILEKKTELLAFSINGL